MCALVWEHLGLNFFPRCVKKLHLASITFSKEGKGNVPAFCTLAVKRSDATRMHIYTYGSVGHPPRTTNERAKFSILQNWAGWNL